MHLLYVCLEGLTAASMMRLNEHAPLLDAEMYRDCASVISCSEGDRCCDGEVRTDTHVPQVLSKRGVDIAFVGGSSSVLAAGGYCSAGGNIVLWDTLAPISGGPIAFLLHHTPLVTALQVYLQPFSMYLQMNHCTTQSNPP